MAKRTISLFIIFLFFSLVLLDIILAITTTYDASDTSTFKGYYDAIVNDPPPPANSLPPDGQTEFTSTEYSKITTSDNTRESTSIADNLEGYIIFNVTFSETSISSFNWTWEGYYNDQSSAPDNNGYISFYMWNFTGSSWFNCTEELTDGSTDVTRYCGAIGDASDFYSNNVAYFMIYGTDPNDVGDSLGNVIYTDYVKLELSYISVILQEPANSIYSSSTEQTFVCNSSDTSLRNITLYLWNSTTNELVFRNETDISGSTNSTTLTYNFTYDNSYDWNCLMYTTEGSSTWASSNRTLTIDTTTPLISYNSNTDSNATWYSRNWIFVNITASDVNRDSVRLDWNNSGNETFTNNVGNYSWENKTSLSDGTYTFYTWVNDTAGNHNATLLRTIYLDTITPLISYDTQTPIDYANLSYNSLYVNVTWTEINFANITFTLKNDTDTVNTTAFTSATYDINWTSLPDINYTYYVNITDFANNMNSTDIRYVTIDTTAPTISIVNPSDYESFDYKENISLNYTISDSGVGFQSCWWTNSSGTVNYTLTCGNNATITEVGDGDYTSIIYANDTIGNEGSSTIHYTVSLTAPAITINFPPNRLWFSSGTNIYFNVTAVDTNGIANCSLWGNWTGTWHLNETNSTPISSGGMYNFTNNISDSGAEIYRFNFECYDTTGTGAWAPSNFTFGIDETKPLVDIVYPTNITYSVTITEINYTFTELNPDSCWYSLNKGETNSTRVACRNNFTGLTSTEGSNNWTVYINDSANNQNSSNIAFIMDTTYPLISYDTQTPIDYANLSYNSLYVNVTWTEINFANITFNLYDANGTVNSTTFTTATYDINWTGLTDAEYKYNVTIRDTINNENTTNTRKVILDTILPTVDYISTPTNGTYSTQTNISISVNITEVNPSNITLLLYNLTSEYNKTTYTEIFKYLDDFDTHRNVSIAWADSGFEKQSVVLITGAKLGKYAINVTGNSSKQSTYNYTSFQTDVNQNWNDYAENGKLSFWIKYENPGAYNITSVTVSFGDVISGTGQTNFSKCVYQDPEQDNQWHRFEFYVNYSKNPAGYSCSQTGTMNWNNIKKIRFNFENTNGFPDEIIYSFLLDDIKLIINNEINWTSLPDNTYTYNVSIIDIVNQENYTETRTITIDTTTPLISYNSNTDSNATWYSRNWIFVNITASDVNRDSVRLDWNNSGNETFTNNVGNYSWENKTSLSDGTYTFYTWVNDTAGNHNATLLRTIYLDTITPLISITNPTNTSYSISKTEINYTFTELNPDSCWYSLNKGETNSTRVACGTNWTGLSSSEGSNNWTMWINDSANNVNSSSTVFFTDTIFPQLNITTPSNATYFNYNSSVYINYSISDTNLQTCWYNIDFGSNSTVTCGTNLSLNFSDESLHTVYLFANDSVNNLNDSEMLSFYCDSISPSVSITSPLNETTSTGISITIEYNISDTFIDTCYFTLRDSAGSVHNYEENASLNCSNTSRALSVLSYAIYTVRIWGEDKSNNLNSSTITFTRESSTTASIGGGAGGRAVTSTVVAVTTHISINKTIPDLSRAIIYSRIKDWCEDFSVSKTTCVLLEEDKLTLKNKLNEQNVEVTMDELDLWIEQYNNQEIGNVEVQKTYVEQYDLDVAIVERIIEFEVTPKRLDPLISFILFTNKRIYKTTSNRVLDSATVVSGDPEISVEIIGNTTADIVLEFPEFPPAFASKVFEAKINYIDKEGNSVFQEVYLRTINLLHIGVWITIGVSIIFIVVIILFRKKIFRFIKLKIKK